MDANNTPSSNASTPGASPATVPVMGGTVEPANRATVAKERFQTPIEPMAPRYELRDPFAEVTYRTNSFPEMVAKANQLGSSRFIAIDEQGHRSTVAPRLAALSSSQTGVPPRRFTAFGGRKAFFCSYRLRERSGR